MRIPTLTADVADVRVFARLSRSSGDNSSSSSMIRRPLLLVVALAGVWAPLGAGCSKKNEGPRPTGLAPSTTGANGPGALTAPAPPGNAAGPVAAAGSPAASITGKITLASERKADVTPNDVVYLVARRISDNPSARGSLVAVKRFSASSFPIDFTLGAADMMFKNGAFEGELTLAARVDKDGDPITRRKGDVFGTVERVKVGTAGVEVKLDHLQTEDESLAGGAPPMQGGMPPGHP